MKLTVKLGSIGNSLGFPLKPKILEALELELGDLVEIEIYTIWKENDSQEVSIFTVRSLVSAGSSKGISVDSSIVDRFGLEPKDLLGIEVKKFEKKS